MGRSLWSVSTERKSRIAVQRTLRAMKTDSGPASVKIPVGLTEVTIASTYTLN